MLEKSYIKKLDQKKYDNKIYLMDEIKMEKYWKWRELDDNWTVETNEDGIPYFLYKYGIILQILITKLTMVKFIGARKILITKYIKKKIQPINIILSAYQERER